MQYCTLLLYEILYSFQGRRQGGGQLGHFALGPILLGAPLCWRSHTVGGSIHSLTNYSPSSYIDAQYTKSRFIVKYKRDASLIYNADSRILNYHGHYVARNYNFAHNYWHLYRIVT